MFSRQVQAVEREPVVALHIACKPMYHDTLNYPLTRLSDRSGVGDRETPWLKWVEWFSFAAAHSTKI